MSVAVDIVFLFLWMLSISQNCSTAKGFSSDRGDFGALMSRGSLRHVVAAAVGRQRGTAAGQSQSGP